MNASRHLLLLAGLTLCSTSCVSIERPPEEPHFARMWSTVGDGLIYTAEYFTEGQTRNPRWETKRLEQRTMVRNCDAPQLSRRDVRWFRSTTGEQCARIVYTFECPMPRATVPGEAAYARDAELLREPKTVIAPGCGDKTRPISTPRRPWPPLPMTWHYDRIAEVNADIRCPSAPEINTGTLHMTNATRFWAEVRVSAKIATALNRQLLSINPLHGPRRIALRGLQHHVIEAASRPAPADGAIFVYLDIAPRADGGLYCLSLTAVQNGTIWRRSIERPHLPASPIKTDKFGHPVDPKAFSLQSDAIALSEMLASALGLDRDAVLLPTATDEHDTSDGAPEAQSPEM